MGFDFRIRLFNRVFMLDFNLSQDRIPSRDEMAEMYDEILLNGEENG